MQFDKLSIAARAAGYAMAVSDELLTSTTPEIDGRSGTWSAGEIKPLSEQSFAAEPNGWRHGIYQLFGWSATA